MMLKKITPWQYAVLAVLLAAGYVFAVTQKYYVPDIIALRTFLLAFVSAGLVLIFFLIVRPVKAYELSRTLSLIMGIAVGLVIVILHLIVTFTPSYKNLIVLAVVMAIPFFSGWIFTLLPVKK
jgi:hypothetical protein